MLKAPETGVCIEICVGRADLETGLLKMWLPSASSADSGFGRIALTWRVRIVLGWAELSLSIRITANGPSRCRLSSINPLTDPSLASLGI